jgi:hypothetical protein
MELLELCNEHEIQVIIGVEPDTQEDISDIKPSSGRRCG